MTFCGGGMSNIILFSVLRGDPMAWWHVSAVICTILSGLSRTRVAPLCPFWSPLLPRRIHDLRRKHLPWRWHVWILIKEEFLLQGFVLISSFSFTYLSMTLSSSQICFSISISSRNSMTYYYTLMKILFSSLISAVHDWSGWKYQTTKLNKYKKCSKFIFFTIWNWDNFYRNKKG